MEQTKQGQPQKAIAIFEQALSLARQTKDKETEATALLSIGLNYSNIGETQKTLDTYNQVLPFLATTIETRYRCPSSFGTSDQVRQSLASMQKQTL